MITRTFIAQVKLSHPMTVQVEFGGNSVGDTIGHECFFDLGEAKTRAEAEVLAFGFVDSVLLFAVPAKHLLEHWPDFDAAKVTVDIRVLERFTLTRKEVA